MSRRILRRFTRRMLTPTPNLFATARAKSPTTPGMLTFTPSIAGVKTHIIESNYSFLVFGTDGDHLYVNASAKIGDIRRILKDSGHCRISVGEFNVYLGPAFCGIKKVAYEQKPDEFYLTTDEVTPVGKLLCFVHDEMVQAKQTA